MTRGNIVGLLMVALGIWIFGAMLERYGLRAVVTGWFISVGWSGLMALGLGFALNAFEESREKK